jgi:hypothetical protein
VPVLLLRLFWQQLDVRHGTLLDTYSLSAASSVVICRCVRREV